MADANNDGMQDQEPPENLEGEFPSPTLVEFNPIENIPYKYVNQRKFAKRWAKFNRNEILKNYELARQIAMSELDTELAGLSKYAPAAAALKRQQTAADNAFNQAQRTKMFDLAMPGVRDQLEAQGQQAAELAKGKIPDFLTDAQDRALELGMRSRSADNSMAGGFGAGSSVARKASDLMSADARYQMGVQEYQLGMQQTQYGNQLLGSNIQQKAGLYMAPTEYSNAGQEMRVMPEVGGARLTAGALTEMNQLNIVPAELAMRSRIQQRQYATTLDQQNRMFNATGMFNASSANAAIENQFKLDKFGYQVGYAGAVAGASNANANTANGVAQQQQASQIFQDYAQQAQQAQQTGAISSGAGTLIGGAAQLINGISGLFNPNTTSTTPLVDESAAGNVDFGYGGPVYADTQQPIADTSSPEIEVGGPVPDFDAGYGETPDYSGSGGPSYGAYQDSGGDGYLRSASGTQFQAATGLRVPPLAQSNSDAIMRMAGITKDANAIPGAVKMGVDYTGRDVYSDVASLQSGDAAAGATMAANLSQIVAPFNALDAGGQARMNGISRVAGDGMVMASLDNAAAQGDVEGFTNTMLGSFGGKPLNDLVYRTDKNGKPLDPATAQGANMAYAAYEAMQNWGQMSPAQRGMLVGTFGVKSTDVQNGRPIGDVAIPTTQTPTTAPVTIGKALGWMSKGINAYPLTKKWDKYTTLAKVVGDSADPDTVANISAQFKLLGAGVNGAEVPGVTAEGLQKAGWSPTPHMGVGAISAKSGATIPQGYVTIADNGQQMIAAPPGTAYSARAAVMKSTPVNNGSAVSTPGAAPGPFNFAGNSQNSTVQTTQNLLNWGVGAYNIYSMWHGRPGMGAAVSSAGTVAQAIDRYNATQGTPSNYGQFAGAAAQAYGAYQAAKEGDYVGSAGYGTAAAFNGMAAWAKNQAASATTEAAKQAALKDAAQYSQYAGYAQAGLNFYGAYNSWQQGDKVGAGLQTVGGGLELASAMGYGNFGGAGLIAQGAAMGYNAWGTGNVAQGAIGGSMMMAGTAMLVGGPVGWAVGGGLMAVSVLGSAFGGGTTNKEHLARNGYRDYLQQNSGLVDQDMNMVLADGTTYNIGMEDDDGRHSVTNPNRLAADQKAGGSDNREGENTLRAYDVDYTNDLDFASAMMGQTLSRLMAGGSDTNVDQIGNSIGNAGIANIGYGQQMTEENFNKMVTNQRSFMAKAGIGSKSDAYQLVNAAYAEGRLDEFQHTQACQALGMMFDEGGYATAQQLMTGRDKGTQVAADNAAAAANARPKEPAKIPADSQIAQTVGEAAGAAGGAAPDWETLPASTAEGVPAIDWKPRPGAEVDPGFTMSPEDLAAWTDKPGGVGVPSDMIPYLRKGTSRMSKEDIRALNASRYQTAAA